MTISRLGKRLNNSLENSHTATRKQQVAFCLSLTALAILMVIGCLLAKRFFLDTVIAKGMGATVSPLPGILLSGIAFSAPIQSAFLLSLLPCSWFRRVAIACAWMIVVVLAFSIGNRAHPFQDSPTMFRSNTLCILPLVAFGWFIPLGLLNRLRGWQLTPSYFSSKSTHQKTSIASLFALTFVASLCLFSLQFGPHGSYMAGVIGMLAGIVFGAIFSSAIYLVMKVKPAYSLVCFFAMVVGTFLFARLIMLAFGTGPNADGTALFLSTIVFTIMSGFALARCFGVDLTTKPARNSRLQKTAHLPETFN